MAMEQPLIDKNSRFYTSYSKKIVSLHQIYKLIEKNGKEYFAPECAGNCNGDFG